MIAVLKTRIEFLDHKAVQIGINNHGAKLFLLQKHIIIIFIEVASCFC